METVELVRAVAAAHRRRTELIAGGEVVTIDGLAVQATGLPDPSMNFCVVEEEPNDPAGALRAAEDALASIDMPFGIDLPAGVFTRLEEAVRDRGLRRLLARQVMTARVGSLPSLAPPWEADIDRARPADLGSLAEVDAEVFGIDPAVSRGLYGTPMAAADDVALLLARFEGRAVGGACAVRVAGTVGVFGVAVLEGARRRGLGGALTSAAARALGMPEDVAWLFPNEGSRPLYERLGFVAGLPWEVWVT